MCLQRSKLNFYDNRADFRKQVESIRIALNLEKCQMADVLGLTINQFNRFLEGSQKLSVTALYRLIETTKLSYEGLESGKINYSVLSLHAKGCLNTIHPKYMTAPFSKRRVVTNILDFAEKIRGPLMRVRVNRYFQVSEHFWRDPDQTINIMLVQDILLYLKRFGFSNHDFYSMGSNVIITAQSSKLGRSLSQSRDPVEVYEHFFLEHIRELEQNCYYNIVQKSDRRLIVESRSNLSITEALQLKHLGNKEGCLVRSGTIAALTQFIGFQNSRVTEVKCVHRGDSVCRFDIDLGSLKPFC